MDLNVLFASQIAQLKQCYADLGHAPQRLQEALRSAVDSELERTLDEVEQAKDDIALLAQQCASYRQVLQADGAQIGSSSVSLEQGTWMARTDAWRAELSRLERQYAARRTQVDRLIASVDVYRPILGDFIPLIGGESADDEGGGDGDDDEGEKRTSGLRVASIPSLRLAENALAACKAELQRRTEVLQEDVDEILQLWSEMAVLPSSSDEEELDGRILRHLGVAPSLVDVGEGCMDFCGDFEEVAGSDGDDDGGLDGDGLCETPSRKSGSERQLTSGGKPKNSLVRPGALLPTLGTMQDVQRRRAELEAERTRRTESLQALYDELIALWKKFDVADEDVDAFVQANSGCSLTVLEAYESELRQMRELKSQHMALFISKVRQDIAELWDQLMMTADERRDSFAPFFYDLAEALNGSDASAVAGQASSIDPSDELLAMHEEKVQSLRDDLATRAKPLELVRQYMRLVDEGKALEESAKDTTRLTGRGVPGQKRDPGRLLREEKMRKRIKILKPKVEEEMMRLIPAWEEESGRPFIIHGARFLDTVELDSQQAQAAKKRVRTVSQNSVVTATPQAHASKRSNVEGSAQRSISASVNSSASRKVSDRNAVAVQQTPTASTSARNRNISGSTPSVAPTPVGQQATTTTTNKANFRSATPSSAAPSHVQPTPSFVRHVEVGVLKTAGVRSNTSMQPPLMPASANGKLRAPAAANTLRLKQQANMKRPSMLLEASLRHAPRPSSDFVKPLSTGAGTTMRALTSLVAAANDSLGPNWAILPDDEDEENLLMM